jgi:integrase
MLGWPLVQQKLQLALALLVGFIMYLRPSQLCRIKVSDVVFPVARLRKGHQKLVVALHPFEGGEPSKTKEFDETMMLDLNHHQFLVPLLQRMVLDRHLNPQDLLFQLTPSTLREWMQDMQVQCQLQQLGPLHPYRLRHGGASTDFWEGHRALADIQKRGRWRTTTSVRRYEKGGRIAQLLSKLPEDIQEQAGWAADNIDKVFANPRLLLRQN